MLLKKHIDKYAKDGQFILALNSREKINVTIGDQDAKIHKRGSFFCSSLTNGAIPGNKCPYKINYNYNQDKRVYELKLLSSILEHNHPLLGRLKLGEKELVRFEIELTPNQHYTISLLCTMQQSLPELLFHLNELYPDTIFHKPLILNIKNKVLDTKFGKDRHNLPALATLCTSIARKGGICEMVPDPDSLGIGYIHLQPKEWREYTMQFGMDSLKMVDGTHGTSQYKNTAIVWTGIDGLFFSYFDGVTFSRSENSSSAIEGASKFFNPVGSIDYINTKDPPKSLLASSTKVKTIINPGTPLMTEEGPAFPIVAEALGLTHVLDRKQHFTQQILPACNHMPHNQQKQFSLNS
jgi:hypothetical protein